MAKYKPSLTVFLAATSAFMGALNIGMVMVWTSLAFDSLEASDSVPRITKNDQNIKSWIASITSIGGMFGGLLSNPIAQKFGFKNSLIIYGIPSTFGWILIFFAKSVTMILVGRLITGFCSGLICGIAPGYVNDISTVNVRGLLGSLFEVFVTIGVLSCDCIGSIKSLSWKYRALICSIPTALMSFLMLFMPETPIWLLVNNRPEEAHESLKRFRRNSNVDLELKEIEEQAKQTRKTSFNFELIKRRDVYKPLIISIIIMLIQQFSGLIAIMTYSGDIFKFSSSIDPTTATVLVGLAQVIGVLFSGSLIDHLGRRIFFIISGTGMSASTAILGYYYYENPNNKNPLNQTIFNITTQPPDQLINYKLTVDSFGWVPVVCLVIFIISLSLGFGPIPWILMPEMTIPSARNIVCSSGTAINYLGGFILAKEFIDMESVLRVHGTFWFFTGVCISGVLFVLIFVPETKGKTIDEIQNILLGRRAKKSNTENNHCNNHCNNQITISSVF